MKAEAQGSSCVCSEQGLDGGGSDENYTEHVWQPYVKKTAKQLGLPDSNSFLMLDSFCAHTTEQIETKMSENSIIV